MGVGVGCVCVFVCVDGVLVVGRGGLSMSPSALWDPVWPLGPRTGESSGGEWLKGEKTLWRRWRTRAWEGVVSRL